MAYSKAYLRRSVKEALTHEKKAAELISKATLEQEMAKTIRATIPENLFNETLAEIEKESKATDANKE